MSEFHNAWYTTCRIHKDVEHPLWRKCPKCSEVITYSEEDLQIAFNDSRHFTPIEDAGIERRTFVNFKQWFLHFKNRKKI